MESNLYFTTDKYQEILKTRFRIPREDVPLILNKLNSAEPVIKQAFVDVVEGKDIELVVHDISYQLLVSDLCMTPLAALLSLDWVMREPENALKAFRKEIVRWKMEGKI